MIFDTFPFRDEFDLLLCRMTELEDVPNLIHIAVEADVDHQDHPKPYLLSENMDQFDRWGNRLLVVRAKNLPTAQDFPDPWAREHAQREWCWEGLRQLDAQPDDIVLHGDVDEIPTELATRFVKPSGFVTFHQMLYSFAIDWLHPGSIADPPTEWWGTIAGRMSHITKFADMRTARCHHLLQLPDAGWHFSWLGGGDAAKRKMNSFCHPEVKALGWYERLHECYETGRHIDNGREGTKLIPVDVDDTYPRWIREGNAPQSWFRPR